MLHVVIDEDESIDEDNTKVMTYSMQNLGIHTGLSFITGSEGKV